MVKRMCGQLRLRLWRRLCYASQRLWLTIARQHLADGERYVGSQAGSGSGGSVWIDCLSFNGAASGLLTANGGRAHTSGVAGGAGGGGQITVRRRFHNYAGQATAEGGTGTDAGQPGYIVWIDNPPKGTLMLIR